MAKKTTTPAGSKLAKPKTAGKAPAKALIDVRAKRRDVDEQARRMELGQAERALARAGSWMCLLDILDNAIDGAQHLERFIDTGGRDHLLQTAANRLWLVDGDEARSVYEPSDASWVEDVRKRLAGEAGYCDVTTPAEALAHAIRAIRKLLKTDLALVRVSGDYRVPSGVELAILRALLESKLSLDAKALAEKLGTRREPTSDKTVQDAVHRLRHECGFAILRTTAGYKLDAGDRELARERGLAVEVVEG